jgi:tRNA (adenine57-N1/adenine58-N1)-methyltransferase
MASTRSPFLHPGPISEPDRLSIIHLKRDLQVPTILKEHDEDDEGYSEGKVVNTRFGSFPHTTLIGLPWGTQVRASKVDTGSRGRRAKKQDKSQDKKRKREDEASEQAIKRRSVNDGVVDETAVSTPAEAIEEKEAVAASSGFIHLLPPTPENWTSSLPHRTQVVYTPDYSYILHRIRARPGTNIIEAGAGSGSFTHASARAVFNGYRAEEEANGAGEQKVRGKVWSFEFHEQRHQKLVEEIKEHGLEGVVQITHRDVCEDGFLVEELSPKADAIFLDLPAPWLALPHLTRSSPPPKPSRGPSEASTPAANGTPDALTKPFISALNPAAPVHLCTFSPCIEQVQRTISAMRKLGWVDIEMVELSQKRLEIRRERIGIDNGVQRGLQTTPASVDEAVTRLIEVEGSFKSFHETGEVKKKDRSNPNSRDKIVESLVDRKVYKEGALVHRTEPEVKTHTSYLVFAVLPQEWTAEDEERARGKWAIKIRREGDKENGEVIGVSKRQMKKAARQAQKDKAIAESGEKVEKNAELGEKPAVEENSEIKKEDTMEVE